MLSTEEHIDGEKNEKFRKLNGVCLWILKTYILVAVYVSVYVQAYVPTPEKCVESTYRINIIDSTLPFCDLCFILDLGLNCDW